MRSISTLATLLVGLAVVFWAPAAKAHCPHGGDDTHEHCGGAPATSNEFRFTGFTDETFNGEPDTIDGGQGMIAMHALCQNDFGENSRMCTDEEFWLSPNAVPPTTFAWMHTGAFTSVNAAPCAGWTSSGPVNGFTVNTDGKPSFQNCSGSSPAFEWPTLTAPLSI